MKHLSLVLLLALITLGAQAEVKLSAMFSDNMVLQQQSEVAIWGWSDARTSISVQTSWNGQNYTTKSDKNGKWKVMVRTPEAGGPFEVTISDDKPVTLKNVMIGEVWLCTGQSNMEMPMKGFMGQPVEGSNMDILKSKNTNIRMISIPRSSKTEPQDNFEGQWKEASPESVRNFSATGYYFGRLLEEMIDVPVGLIDVSFGGSCIQAWMSKETSVEFEGKKVPEKGDSIPEVNRTPTVLFNGMLHPVIGYGIKGCIWYQGETNYIEADKYEELLPTMVNEWRTLWDQGDFPFYYAQIAPFDYSVFKPLEDREEKHNSAYLRDAQRKAEAKIPNSGMVVLMDIGEETSIHPMKKKVGGERLAMYALGDTYNMEGFGYKSPSFKAMSVDGSNVVVSFNHTNGLTSYGKEIKCFEIAGKDKRFYPATVFLRSKSVVLSSPRVKNPVAVRYAFKDFIIGELFGTDGLPVSSFRTDEW